MQPKDPKKISVCRETATRYYWQICFSSRRDENTNVTQEGLDVFLSKVIAFPKLYAATYRLKTEYGKNPNQENPTNAA